jgi:alpha-glucosidase
VLLTDANLVDYTDTALQFVGNDTFRAVFHNDRDGFDASGEIVSSWRAAIIVTDLNALVNSDLVQNLCPPADAKLFADAESWIKPGRATWHWMVTRGPKMELQREWVDLTAALNFEYYMIDDGWNRWRQEGKDAWACLRDVVEYAKTRSVGIWAWVDSKELLDHASRQAFFEKARATGLAGLKVDFMKPADTQWVTWYEETIRQAAEHKLMLNFHGSLRPTGRQRTLPNDLTRESVRGREMGKQAPLHDTILPFTRMVQGPTDYTPVDFRADKLKNSSYAHELSMAVIFTSPFFCYGGSPADYLQSEAAELIKRLPATWDETRVLPGSRVGELAAFARRSGTDWYIGVMNGAEVEGFTIDLGFLGDGSYNAEQFGDVPDRHDAFARTSGTLTAKDEIRANLRRDGGLVVRLTRAGG